MKLEKGMFIRTNSGTIDILEKTAKELFSRNVFTKRCGHNIAENEITKASFNLIDLIKVGDFVNGRKVTNVWKDELVLYAGAETTYTIKDEDIEEILTHEQYEANCYKAGE